MRHSIISLTSICAMTCLVDFAIADIEYHFVPAMNGQPTGCAQFSEIAPVVGPSAFTTTVAGSRFGCTPNGGLQDAYAYMDKWGLGVLNPQAGTDKGITGQVELDGKNGGEYLRLEFPTQVRLTYLTFSSVGSGDRFELIADTTDKVDIFGNATILEISSSQNNWPGRVDFPTTAPFRFAKVWDIVISSTGLGDGVQLENVGIEAVPEPSTLVLWLAGFAVVGITVARRAKRNHR